MSWKNWPSWLKGGVIGAGVGILLSILFYFSIVVATLSVPNVLTYLFSPFLDFFLLLSLPWSYIIFFILTSYYPYSGDLAEVIPFYIGILAGLIINGFIVGILKQKKLLLKFVLVLITIIALVVSMLLLAHLHGISIGCGYKKASTEHRVYDSQGRVTGMVNGEIKREIPDSVYFSGYEESWGFSLTGCIIQKSCWGKEFPAEVLIFEPNDTYVTEIFSLSKGNYNLDLFSFKVTNIPISLGETHQFYFDWGALAKGEEGATILIDENNDKIFEKNITSDKELSCKEFLLKTGKISYSKVLLISIIFIIIACVLIIIFVIVIIYTIKYKKKKIK